MGERRKVVYGSANGNELTWSDNCVALGSEKNYVLRDPREGESPGGMLYYSGETKCCHDYSCHFHNPRHICLMYFESGKGELRVDETEYHIESGQIVLMREGHEWQFTTDPDDPWMLYWINIHSLNFFPLFDFYKIPPSLCFTDGDLIFTFKKMHDEIKDSSHSFEERRDRSLQYLLHYIQTLSALLRGTQKSKPQAKDADIIADYINTHITEDIHVSELAKLVFRSTFNATNIFKAKYGCTIKDYILNAKCEVAARMLSENNYSIMQIANILNFCDSQHFSQVFRRRYGVTPSAFRKGKTEDGTASPK